MNAMRQQCGRVWASQASVQRLHQPRMNPTDTLPMLVQSFVEGGDQAATLLSEFMRHVAKVCRPYPAAYFALSDKSEESVDDLGHRAFTVCAKIEKGRFPFMSRTPFSAFVAEQFDGRTIRYHSFYAKISITREILRDDYAKNIRRDPVLRWRAEIYAQIGDALKQFATAVPQGRGVPPRWQLSTPGLRAIQPLEVVEARLRAMDERSVEGLVRAALQDAGAMTQSRLANLLGTILPAPSGDIEEAQPVTPVLAEHMDLRAAVAAAWDGLETPDRTLIIALARGDSYEDLIASDARFTHKVAVSRAVSRVGKHFLQRVIEQIGGEATPSATPRTLMEPIIAVLIELHPDAFERGES
jgi:hypothetical protein